MPLVNMASRFFMHCLTDFHMHGEDKLAAALHRPPGTPLITVSNHVGALDDPFVISAILPPEVAADANTVRSCDVFCCPFPCLVPEGGGGHLDTNIATSAIGTDGDVIASGAVRCGGPCAPLTVASNTACCRHSSGRQRCVVAALNAVPAVPRDGNDKPIVE